MNTWKTRITIPAVEGSDLHDELAAILSGFADWSEVEKNPLTALLNRVVVAAEEQVEEEVEEQVEEEVEEQVEEEVEALPAEIIERLESQVVPTSLSQVYTEGAFRIQFECELPNLSPLNAFVSALGDTWPNEIPVEAISVESGQATRVFMRKGYYLGIYAGDIFKYHVQPELRPFITEMTSFTNFYEYPKMRLVIEEKSEVETLDMVESTATLTHASENTVEA